MNTKCQQVGMIVQYLSFIVMIIMISNQVGHAAVFKIGYLGPATYKQEGLFGAVEIAGAVALAIDEINNDTTLLPKHQLQQFYYDTNCDAKSSLDAIVSAVRDQGVDAFIGPACSPGCISGGLLAAKWNLPMISYVSTSPTMSSHAVYNTFARTSGPLSQQATAFKEVIHYYNWRRFSLICNEAENRLIWTILCSSIIKLSEKTTENGYTITDTHKVDLINANQSSIAHLLETLAQSSRIITVVADTKYLRKLMLVAARKDMTKGNFVFITFGGNPGLSFQRTAWINKDDVANEDVAFQAFSNVYFLSTKAQHSSKSYEKFEKKVRQIMNLTQKQVGLYAGFLYDAVKLYAHGLNRTLMQGGNSKNGSLITNNMINSRFEGVSGDVVLDSNGDRILSYDFSYLNISANSYEVALVYDGSTGNVTKYKEIVWVGKDMPRDEPECGFDGSKCLNTNVILVTITTVVCCVTTIIMAIGLYLYRKLTFEARLNNMTWKIDMKDVTLMHYHEKTHYDLQASILELSNLSSMQKIRNGFKNESSYSLETMTDDSVSNRKCPRPQFYTDIAFYKANRLAVKKFNFAKKLEFSRHVLLEFHQLNNIHHDNLNPFVGAALQDNKIYILTNYCPRGSLQDVLRSENNELDIVFKLSFAYDIIKGMIHIHSSDIKVHGNLTSTNCLVDGRWTVKVTDFGLPSLRGSVTTRISNVLADNDLPLTDLFWIAPELLRTSISTNGTQAGDVYSFGVIWSEIMTRSLPYSIAKESVETIINKIKLGNTSPLMRPPIDEFDCPDEIGTMIRSCWDESPPARPTFASIKKLLKTSFYGQDTDILGNVVALLEKYANHLEELVDERTNELIEEKKKTDDLLYRMLPEQVAEQLKKGETVTAELYEEVSIYFSDIVGFTKLSACSTPMQVVNLLNDLYSLFDSIIVGYDVYKIETIGDAYMVASGLPVKNGNKHAREIANMAVCILESVSRFRIRHMPTKSLQLRIGIHSGPVVAGVVGITMPRYCLFGDTVNTASRMESHGEASRIHISEVTKLILDKTNEYSIVERGEISIKGKGKVRTYWLRPKYALKNLRKKFIPRENSILVEDNIITDV